MTRYHVLQHGFFEGRTLVPSYVVIEADIDPAPPMPGLFKICSVPLTLDVAENQARLWNEDGRE